MTQQEIAMARQGRANEGSTLKPYEYRKLDSPRDIRLLKLHRKVVCSPPTGELVHRSLDEIPAFEAASYTWGDKEPSFPVIVDDGQVLVTSAVDQLLFYRRMVWGPRFLWIDAVCINQSDKDEKDKQLPLMTEIYRRAARVIVWLGPLENIQESRVARRLMMHLYCVQGLRTTGLSEKIKIADMLPTLFTEEAAPFVALSRLFRHLWFQRIWVVQEVAAAEVVHVMYNGICIEWNTLAQAVREIHSAINLSRQMKYYDDTKTSTIETIGRDPSLDYSYWLNAEIMATIRDQVQNGNPLPLAVLILGTLGFKSKDPRDKLFALLGIASDGADLPLTPSYNESVESVFTNVTSFVLSSESWFMLLASTGRGYEAAGSTRPPDSPLPKDLPSWVPDYTTNDFGGALSRGVRDKMLRSRQAGKVAFTDNPRVIRIEAVAFDSIRLVDSKLKYPTFGFRTPDPELPTGTFTKRMEELLTSTAAEGQNWYLEARQLTRSYSASSRESQEAADQQFWELCMSGNPSFENSDSSPALYPLLSQSARKLFEFFKLTERSHFWQHVGDWSMKEKLSEEEVVKLYTNLEQRFFETTSEKAFCVTSTGSVALAPPLAREGDVLVHVKGDYTPLVLRRKESGERRAELVGSCYVHGVQDLCPGSDWEVWSLE